jgi:hypothetical protein
LTEESAHFGFGLTQIIFPWENQKDAHLKMKHDGALALEFGRREVPRPRVGRNDPFSPPYVWCTPHPACASQQPAGLFLYLSRHVGRRRPFRRGPYCCTKSYVCIVTWIMDRGGWCAVPVAPVADAGDRSDRGCRAGTRRRVRPENPGHFVSRQRKRKPRARHTDTLHTVSCTGNHVL